MKTPLESLYEIFLPWHPATGASADERLRVLDAVRDQHPTTGWSLLIGLLPKGRDIAVGTAQPRWHSWVPQETRHVSFADVQEQTQQISHRLLSDVGLDIGRWTELIGVSDDLPSSQLDQLLDTLGQIPVEVLDEGDVIALRNAVRKVISHHWRYPDATWALPDQYVERLLEQYERFRPSDPVNRDAWVFAPWPALPARRPAKGDHEDEQRIAREWRMTAIRDVLDMGGIEAVARLVMVAESPWLVGYTLALADQDATMEALRPRLGSTDERQRDASLGMLAGISEGSNGLQGLRELLDSAAWTPDQRGEVYLALPFGPPTWDELEAESPEVVAHYWRTVDPHGRGQGAAADVVIRAAKNYLKWGTPERALRVLALYGIASGSAEVQLKLDILDALVADTPSDPVVWRDLGHDLVDTLPSVAGDKSVDLRRVGSIEWYFLPVLSDVVFGYRPTALDAVLAIDPRFFVTVLSTVYRREGAEERAPSQEEQARAHSGFTLLNNWSRLPGLHDGVVVRQELEDWVRSVLEIAKHERLGTVAAAHVGNVLAFSPDGADGLWPDIEVRNVIESVASDGVEHGFEIQVYNNRGTTTRGIDEGGDQERLLAGRFKRLADAIAQSWPRTGAVLRRIGLTYEFDARREDERAERMAHGLEP